MPATPSTALRRYERLAEEVAVAVEQGAVDDTIVQKAEALELRHQLIPRQERDGLELEPRSLVDQVRRLALRNAMKKSGNTMRYLPIETRQPGLGKKECLR